MPCIGSSTTRITTPQPHPPRQRDRIAKAAKVWAERNAQRKRVIGDEESAEWINTVLYRFWQFYEPG